MDYVVAFVMAGFFPDFDDDKVGVVLDLTVLLHDDFQLDDFDLKQEGLSGQLMIYLFALLVLNFVLWNQLGLLPFETPLAHQRYFVKFVANLLPFLNVVTKFVIELAGRKFEFVHNHPYLLHYIEIYFVVVLLQERGKLRFQQIFRRHLLQNHLVETDPSQYYFDLFDAKLQTQR